MPVSRRLPVALALAALALPALAAPAAARSYRYVDLGLVTPTAVNARNEVAATRIELVPGGSQIRQVGLRIAATGEATALAPLPGGLAGGFWGGADIAADGSIVGSSSGPVNGLASIYPVIWPGVSTTAVALSTSAEGSGFATAIAPTADVVVGWHYRFDADIQENVRVPWASPRTGLAADAGGRREQLLDVNDAGDRILVTDVAPFHVVIRGGARVPLGILVEPGHVLGEDGGVAGYVQAGPARHAALRRPDGTVVDTGLEFFHPAATQGGALAGYILEFPRYPTPHAFVWKAGALTDLAEVVPGHPVLEAPADIATNGTIVGSNAVTDDPLNRRHGWMLLYQVKITGQVVEPSLPPASPAGAAARAATRPVKGARVVLTPAGGTAITVKTDAQGRFSADLPAGRVAVAITGRSGCITAACTTATIDLQDDLALAVRLDPLAKPAAPTLPKGAIRVTRGGVPLTLRCRLVSAPCRITVTIRQKRKVLATAALTVRPGKTATRPLPLTKAGKAALASGTTVRATLTLVTRTPTGRATTTGAIRIRR